jgi:hypothetical protein
MTMTQDAFAARQREMEEQQREYERGSRRNVEVFTKMFLGLGVDAIKAAGSSHDAELAEARALAADRWSKFLDLEAQIVREEQQLALRPKKRPAQPGDETLPDRTLAQRNVDYELQTKDRREGLAALREQAKRERKELESFITKRR